MEARPPAPRRGRPAVATLEMVMALPILVLLFALIFSLGFAGLAKLSATVEARQGTRVASRPETARETDEGSGYQALHRCIRPTGNRGPRAVRTCLPRQDARGYRSLPSRPRAAWLDSMPTARGWGNRRLRSFGYPARRGVRRRISPFSS